MDDRQDHTQPQGKTLKFMPDAQDAHPPCSLESNGIDQAIHPKILDARDNLCVAVDIQIRYNPVT